MDNIVAERKLIAEFNTGARKLITIKIGQPFQADEDQWSCPLSIDGLINQLPNANGIDSFQSLMLAQNLIKTLLHAVIEDGGKLFSYYDEDDDDPSEIDLNAMFGKGL